MRGPLAPLAGEPDDVVRVIERALSVLPAADPVPRHPVGPCAHGVRGLLSDRLWDAFLRRTYREPAP